MLKKRKISIILFISFVLYYSSLYKSLPISYWDEVTWVKRSYFFQPFIQGDYSHPVWQSEESYGLPKFQEYVYGVWLYPRYIKGKLLGLPYSDYASYIIRQGFYEKSLYLDRYSKDIREAFIIPYEERDVGFPDFYIRKYGLQVIPSINLIYKARQLNILLLSGGVVLAFLIARLLKLQKFSVVFAVWYGLNTLFINTGLKAHSEALFNFLNNAALFLILLYFMNGRKNKHLLGFSVFSGLCAATKLNGFMWIGIFIFLNIMSWIYEKKFHVRDIIHIAIAIAISFSIFVICNPYTYSYPLKNTLYMLTWKTKEAVDQSQIFPEVYLPTVSTRIQTIIRHFYGFSSSSFSGIKPILHLLNNVYYSLVFLILFIIGMFSAVLNIYRKNLVSALMLVIFLLIFSLLCWYLILDWDRYYVPLVFFLIFYQVIGTREVYKFLKSHLTK